MKKYRIDFQIHSSIRYSWEGFAVNEFFAIAKAYEENINLPKNNQTMFWTDFDPGFKIVIERILH